MRYVFVCSGWLQKSFYQLGFGSSSNTTGYFLIVRDRSADYTPGLKLFSLSLSIRLTDSAPICHCILELSAEIGLNHR